MRSLFEPDGGRLVPGDLARGPWSPDALHGGPVAAVLARAFELHDDAVAPRGEQLLARLTVELVRPVPLAPLSIDVEPERGGRRVQLLRAVLRSGDTELARARGVRVRLADVPLPDEAGDAPAVPPPPPDTGERFVDDRTPYEAFHNSGAELCFVRGSFEEPGPAVVWIRLAVPVLPDEVPSGVQRAVAAGDFPNGVSRLLPFEGWLFVNADLTVGLRRQPAGEWIALDAASHLTSRGTGFAEAALWDGAGFVGRSMQTLVVDRR